ncbi:5-oxoprolinase subunit PxpA [Parasphingorhabdus litoris]|uniref:5-oxoprolinase subunit PxpA n=1 Tax=Parasphingorhabdus litoris TaxID=394733 RepID=A0ABP3KH19_9SPHN|nr:5-oxoprolinase subunit PxpA [Parasphingorhabdus litoris]
MTLTIDLNADLGEDDSSEGMARDIAIMDIVSSCNIACGGHAGSSKTMHAMLVAAKAKDVSAGAHPSYPDRENFGRVSMEIDPVHLETSLLEQVAAIKSVATDVKSRITHLKPHGALYNDAQDNDVLAEILVHLARREDLTLVGMADSLVQQKAAESGVRFVSEAFIDRQYTEHSRLVPRTEKGAVIQDDSERLQQGLALALGQPIKTAGNQTKIIPADTLCLHSDSDGALATATAMRRALELEGISVAAPRDQ